MLKSLPRLNTTLRWFMLAMILANIGSQMLFTLLAVYLAQLGASVQQVGLVFSLASIVPLLLQIIGGWLSDTIGRLRTIAIGSVAASFGYILLPLAPSWPWAILALSLEYVSGSMVGPSFSAFIAEQSGEADRGRVFGLTKAIYLTVAVIGPLLGGLLAQRYGFRAMLWIAAVLYVGASIMRVWMATSVRFGAAANSERPTLATLGNSVRSMTAMVAAGGLVAWILLTDGVSDVAYALSWDLAPLYLAEVGSLDPQRIGWLAAIRGVSMIGATLAAGWLSDRYGERRIIATGFFLQFLAFMVFIVSRDVVSFTLAATVQGLGFGTLIPAFDSLVSKAIPEKMRGIAFGLFGTSIGLISLPAPWLGARLWEWVSPQAPFLVTGLIALTCVLPVWVKFALPAKAEPA